MRHRVQVAVPHRNHLDARRVLDGCAQQDAALLRHAQRTAHGVDVELGAGKDGILHGGQRHGCKRTCGVARPAPVGPQRPVGACLALGFPVEHMRVGNRAHVGGHQLVAQDEGVRLQGRRLVIRGHDIGVGERTGSGGRDLAHARLQDVWELLKGQPRLRHGHAHRVPAVVGALRAHQRADVLLDDLARAVVGKAAEHTAPDGGGGHSRAGRHLLAHLTQVVAPCPICHYSLSW